MKVLNLGSAQYGDMWEANGHELVKTIPDADIVQFTGGEDVSPSLYGETEHPRTFSNPLRDDNELEIFNVCVQLRKAMAGICRGGQFLNVANGGSMWQHVNNHAIRGTHMAVDVRTGVVVDVSSTHHQMMDPGEAAEVIAVASESTWKECMQDGAVQNVLSERGEDIEVLWYEETQSLCFQPHPEFFDKDHPCQKYYFQLINEFIGV